MRNSPAEILDLRPELRLIQLPNIFLYLYHILLLYVN